MHEASKSIMRRLADIRFATRYFLGAGSDVGCGSDPISAYAEFFPGLRQIRNWDVHDGDAQYLPGVPDESLDFVHSSHCLEHMRDPFVALGNWARVLKEGGHMVVIVPDEDLYEQGIFPSRFNTDHKWTFTIHKAMSWSQRSVNLFDLLKSLQGFQVIKVELLDATFRYDLQDMDQTMTPIGECAIEFIIRKYTEKDRQKRGRLPGALR